MSLFYFVFLIYNLLDEFAKFELLNNLIIKQMKKVLFLFALSICSLVAWAYDFSAVAPSGQTLYYTLTSDSTVKVSGDTTLTGSLTIPNSVANGSTIYSVTSIGDSAFCNCTGITSVTIPNGVTTIGYRAFFGCSGITSFDLPNSLTDISASAFTGCASLTNIVIPDSVTSIPESVFYGCRSLTSVTIPNTVTSIERAAFFNCSSLPNVTIPDSVTSIGYGAFAACSSLTSVNIGNSVTSIGEQAFFVCSSLSSVNIPNSVLSIGKSAFAYCSSLTSVTIPNSMINLGDYIFVECTNLTNVNIPNSVTSLGKSAFYNCRSLTSITIPNSVTTIGEGAFSNCSSLNSLVVEDGNTVYDSRESCNAIIETDSNTMIAGTKNTFIPNSVTGISNFAFYGCTGLTNITIPNSVERIGEEAFSGCDHLDTIICNAVTPPTVADVNAFEGVWKGLPLIVPGESVGQYQSAYVWRDFTNIIGAPLGIEDVDNEYKVYATNGNIAVSGAVGQDLRIYDVQGRLIVSEQIADNKLYAVPTTGVYMVQVGKLRAKKVMVVR